MSSPSSHASPWSSGADSSSIWNSNSPNLNLLRRYSLRSSSMAASTSTSQQQPLVNPVSALANSPSFTPSPKTQCTWEASADHKYLIGYLVISRQDLEIYSATLGFQLSGGKPTHDNKFGAIVEHVVPGSLMNIVCKLKVGDEIVEWNGYCLRNKRNEEVCEIVESSLKPHAASLRLVVIRALNNNQNQPISSHSVGSNSQNSNSNSHKVADGLNIERQAGGSSTNL